MKRAFEIMAAGAHALKAKDFTRAEDLLLAALKAYDHEPANDRTGALDPHGTAYIHLGILYRQTGRYEDALNILERALPIPGAFTELVSVLRFLGKAAKKDGDQSAWAEWYRRMYCLAKIHATVMTLRVQCGTVMATDWNRGGSWLDEIRRQCGSIYAYQFDGQKVPGDTLLSEADYGALCKGAEAVGGA